MQLEPLCLAWRLSLSLLLLRLNLFLFFFFFCFTQTTWAKTFPFREGTMLAQNTGKELVEKGKALILNCLLECAPIWPPLQLCNSPISQPEGFNSRPQAETRATWQLEIANLSKFIF